MRRYVKRVIAVLAVALMCSSLIGGGVMAEDGSGKDGNDGQTVEGAGSNEAVPEESPEGEPEAVSGETEVNTEGAEGAPVQSKTLSDRSASDCPVFLIMRSTPGSGIESTPKNVDLGDTIVYSAEVENQTNEKLTNVEVKFHIDDALETDIRTAQFDLTGSKEDIAGNSNFSARLEGNDVVFKAKELNLGDTVTYYITCTTKTQGNISSYASVRSVGGTSYSDVKSSVQYHNVHLEVCDFSFSTNINSNKQWVNPSSVFSYTINFTKDGKGLNTTIPYKLMSGSTVVSEETLTLENGIGTVSFPSNYAFKTDQMPTGLTYTVSHGANDNFTWDKDSFTGTTDLSGVSNRFTATYKYVPVKYSLDTNIVVNMQGRDFKSGDSFTYAVAPVDGAPIFNRYSLPYGDSDSPAYFEGTARINPTGGTTATLPLEENIQRRTCIRQLGCGYIYVPEKGDDGLIHDINCGCNYTVEVRPINIAPEIIFAFPGTYNYTVFQTSMYTDDSDSIIADTTQYRVSVKVTASGSTLTPTLSSVKKSTDGGKTWVAVADKSKLAFTNKLMPDGVRKGDIDRDGKVTMADVMACLNHVSKKKLLTGQALAAADVDGNGVGMSDVIKILNYVSKKSPSL